MLAAELEALGPRSASDPELLARLGWTRERVVQVMRVMEKAGLLDHQFEKQGVGRPRKVYALKDVESFL
jgi:predicted ArsR family transcriptional regulator